MTKDEILKIKEHIEIHAKKEPHAVKITKILRKAVDELEYLAELEKENTELREQCAILADCNTCVSACKAENVEMKIQFTEAKEIIENIVRVTWGEGWSYSLDWKVKAEQFLSDSE